MASRSKVAALVSELPDGFKRLSIALAGGIAAGFALPRFGIWPLIFVSIYLIHLSIRGLGFWRGFGVGFVAGAAFYASQSVWMSAYLGPEPWLALAALEGLIFATGMGAAAFVWTAIQRQETMFGKWRQLATIVALAAIWVTREWVACHWPYGGYQWSRLGQALAPTPFASLAYFGGISLVSLFAVLVALSLLVLPKAAVLPRALGALPALTLLVASLLAPAQIAANIHRSERSAQPVQVTAVQGNANAGLFANPDEGSILSKHIAATERFVAQNPQLFEKRGFTVWPENASDIDPTNNPLASAAIERVANDVVKQPLLVGAVTNRGENTYNSVLSYLPGVGLTNTYDKRRPVPFGEYVPDRELWRPLAPDLIDLIWRGFTPGTKPGLFKVSGTTTGSLICFEIGIDELTHDLVTGGAEIVLSQANNADFGRTDEAFQQESLARLQAIATGRTVVHVSTVATTEIIRPDGTIDAGPVKAFTPGALSAAVTPSKAVTPAMAFFGWCDTLCALLSALAIAFALVTGLRCRLDRKSSALSDSF